MEIREITEYNENEILPLYTAVGWTAYTENPKALAQGFSEFSKLGCCGFMKG